MVCQNGRYNVNVTGLDWPFNFTNIKTTLGTLSYWPKLFTSRLKFTARLLVNFDLQVELVGHQWPEVTWLFWQPLKEFESRVDWCRNWSWTGSNISVDDSSIQQRYIHGKFWNYFKLLWTPLIEPWIGELHEFSPGEADWFKWVWFGIAWRMHRETSWGRTQE